MQLFAAEPRSSAGFLFSPQYLCGAIFFTPYSMVWDWANCRANSFWPFNCFLPFCLLLFSLSLLSFYGLALYGLALQTDRVLFAFSKPCISIHFLIIIIIIKCRPITVIQMLVYRGNFLKISAQQPKI